MFLVDVLDMTYEGIPAAEILCIGLAPMVCIVPRVPLAYS